MCHKGEDIFALTAFRNIQLLRAEGNIRAQCFKTLASLRQGSYLPFISLPTPSRIQRFPELQNAIAHPRRGLNFDASSLPMMRMNPRIYSPQSIPINTFPHLLQPRNRTCTKSSEDSAPRTFIPRATTILSDPSPGRNHVRTRVRAGGLVGGGRGSSSQPVLGGPAAITQRARIGGSASGIRDQNL